MRRQLTLQDILSREAGIQTTSLYGGVNGTGAAVDMRGFGVTAPSNTLVLIDGRRFNDLDIAGFDFSFDSPSTASIASKSPAATAAACSTATARSAVSSTS